MAISVVGYHRERVFQRLRRYWLGYVFISPWGILYLIFGIYPLFLSFFLTFFNYAFATPEMQSFVGVGNWLRGLTDPLFWKSLGNIFYNQFIFITAKNGLGLLLASLLFRVRFGAGLFRTIYFLPVLTSTVVLMSIGDNLASPGGPIQRWLLENGWISELLYWKSEDLYPMLIIALINTWKWFGISTIILLAGMYSIDPRLYEAAQVDGANGWQLFRYLTLPLLRPQLFFLLVVDVINGLQMFGEILSIGFDVYGGINNQALTPVLYLYATAFGADERPNIGYASTLGVLLGLLIAVLTVIQFRVLRSEAD